MGGGCKDYFNLDCMNEPLSDCVLTMDALFLLLYSHSDCLYCLEAII